MNKKYKKIFIRALLFYITVVMYTRFVEAPFRDPISAAFYSLPLEFLDGKKSVEIETYCLSASKIAEFLEKDPQDCSCFEDKIHPEYLILRYKRKGYHHFGDLKVYFSSFSRPILTHISLLNNLDNHTDLIVPIPYQRDKQPCKTSTHWKNFW